MFVLNFLLAIIVEAYMELREEIKGRNTSKDFVSDLVLVAYTTRLRLRYGWPNPDGYRTTQTVFCQSEPLFSTAALFLKYKAVFSN